VYSPTHIVDVERQSDHEALVTWEAKDTRPDTDLVLYYSVSRDDVGIDLIAHRQPGEKGFYMLLASPRVEIDRSKIQPKNVVFLLDRTGSMAGEKIEQVKAALRFCINSLKPQDRFNVITFNETPHPLFNEMQKPLAEARKRALDAVDEIDATGGTNINEALGAALTQFRKSGVSSNAYLVFLTDGQPTVGVTDTAAILRKVKASNTSGIQIFVFGAGYDVNTHFLDKLALENKGDADYVRPRENIEEKVSSFFAKVSDPLLSDVTISISGGGPSDAFPSQDIPDIFVGTQIIVFGRYSDSGDVKVQLSGVSNGKRRTFTLNTVLPKEEDANEFIPQLWAARKIGYLLDEIRLHSNQELVDEVVRLSKEYGIPTEFTSFLADDRKFAGNTVLASANARAQVYTASKVDTGSYGMAQSANAGALRSQTQLPAAAAPAPEEMKHAYKLGSTAANGRAGGLYYNARDEAVMVANVQNVSRRTFYQRGSFWEDAGLKENQQSMRIKQFSNAHFKLIKADRRVAQYSTLGNVRIVLENNQAIEIGPDGKDEMTDAEINALLKPEPAKTKGSLSP
jgi:Ca-activated chloride channel homolog